MDMERRYHRLQRATVARSALDVIAMIFLACGFAFWGVAFWQLLSPPALLSLLSIQVVVLGLVYSLATPLLWSALVPSTPAGQLLQKTQWRTFGFAAIVAAALYLTYQAEWMIEAWLSAQPGVRENGLGRGLAISLSIGFILIPALAWTQLTPERWLQQIQQAHMVKKLEIEQKGELAILKARLLWAKQKTAAGFANLLPAEREDVLQVIRGLFMAIGDSQRDIARTLGLSAELERDMLGDDAIADRLEYVKTLLEAGEVPTPARALAESGESRADAPGAFGRTERAEHAPVPHTESHQTHDAGRVTLTQGNAARDEAYTLAYDQLSGGAWTVRELAELLDVAESTARDIRIKWTAAGLVSGKGLPNGRYNFTEREVR